MVNFAHGALFMIGAYAGLCTASLTGSFWWGLLLAPILIGAFGMLIEFVLIRRLYGRSIDDPLLLTFGLSYVWSRACASCSAVTAFRFRPRRSWSACWISASASSRAIACSSSRW